MNSPSHSEQIHLASAQGPRRGPAAARRHHAAVAGQPDRHHAGAQRPDADADAGVHHHPEPLLPPPVPVAHPRRDGLVDDHAPGGRHERHGGGAPRRVLEPGDGRPPERDVAVGVGQRGTALAAAVPERDALIGVPRHGAGAHGGVQGGRRRRGVAEEAEPHGVQRLQVERRRPRAVVEVREARRGEGQAEREEGEPRGEAARAAARAPAAAATVLLLAVPRRRLPRAAGGRRVLVVEVVLACRRGLERRRRRRRESWLLERRRGPGGAIG